VLPGPILLPGEHGGTSGLILLTLSAGGGCGNHSAVSSGTMALADLAAKSPACEELEDARGMD